MVEMAQKKKSPSPHQPLVRLVMVKAPKTAVISSPVQHVAVQAWCGYSKDFLRCSKPAQAVMALANKSKTLAATVMAVASKKNRAPLKSPSQQGWIMVTVFA